MLTKAQKESHVALSSKLIAGSKALVFADFSGAPTKEINKLKAELKKAGATYKVVKKRLLNIALKEAGIETDGLAVKAPVATIFAPEDLTSVAGAIYKFAKELAKAKINFSVVGAFDREQGKAVSIEEFNVIARLPSREVLLGQVVGTMTGPLRKFMVVLQEIAKQKEQGAPAAAPAPEPVPAPAEPAPAEALVAAAEAPAAEATEQPAA